MNMPKQLHHRCGRNIVCGALLFAGNFLWSAAAPAESAAEAMPANANGEFYQKCIKLLNYGGELSYTKPGKRDAAVALGLLGDEKAVPILVEHLQNEESNDLRMQLVRALGWIGSPKAVPALENALRDKYPYVRFQAAYALKGITGKDYPFDRTGLPDPNRLREALRATAEAAKAEGNQAPAPISSTSSPQAPASATAPAAPETRQP